MKVHNTLVIKSSRRSIECSTVCFSRLRATVFKWGP